MDSQSNIWFEKVYRFEDPDEDFDEHIDGVFIDNRPIAYRLTPRLNSLLRDLRLLADQHGAEVIFNDQRIEATYIYPEYLTEHGILLDGRIIYEEDIREGRVSLPK